MQQRLLRDIPGVLMIRNLILQDVQLKVILEEVSGIFRMLLVRHDHSATVTFECRSIPGF